MSRGYLLVRVEGKAYGLPLARVLEVGDLAEVLDVPRALPAMRGLTPLRGRLVPVVHLGALLGERTPPPERGRAAGAAGRVAAVGVGGGAPPRRPRADPRPRRPGRSDRMTTGDDVQLVTFKVAGQDLAFNIFQVERILRYEAPAPLPKAPDFLEGVLRYQGVAVPLIDLRKQLSAPAPLREDTRTVILEWEGGKMGIIVDAVTEVLQVAAPEITSPPSIEDHG